MSYGLGLDVGTTFTAAAIFRQGNVEVFPLATYQVGVPSVIFAEGDEMLFGGAAERRGAAQPHGLAREFKRRLGDPVPLMLSGSPYHADRLTALMARWIVDTVTEQVGSAPGTIVMTHPANWTDYQLGTLRNALADVGLASTTLTSEPAAAALDYAAVANLPRGSRVLVYDLGGGTFDVALLRFEGDTFEHDIEPAGIERLGGIDFDQAVFEHVRSTIPSEVLESARLNPEGSAAIAQLRRRCVEAKEALSSDAVTDIPIMLPGYTRTVRITRPEFEAMIRPMIVQTIELVEQTLERATIDPASLDAVLLVGGSSRIPSVSAMVSAKLGLPVRVDAHPKLVVAKGAARRAGVETAADTGPRTRRRRADGVGVDGGERERGRRGLAIAGSLIAIAVAGIGAWFLFDRRGSDGAASTASTVPSQVTSVAPTGASTPGSPVQSSPVEPITPAFVPFATTSQLPTLPEPIDLEVVGTDLWVMSQAEGTLQRFDITTPVPQLVETVALGFNGGRNGSDIIPTDGALYVTQYDNETVARVDLSTSPASVTSIPVPGRPLNGTVLDGTVWVTLQPLEASVEPMALVPIDGTAAGAPVPMPQLPYGILAVEDELWITFDDDDRIGHFDPSGDPSAMQYVDELAEPIDMLAVDDQLWVTLRDQDNVAIVRREDGSIRRYVEAGSQPFKLIEALGSVWVTNNGNGADDRGSVSRLIPVNRRRLQPDIIAGFAPLEIATGADRIFVANFGDSTVSILTSAILITDDGLSDARAAPGATVYVRNDGTTPHALTADDGSFTTGDILPGSIGSFIAPSSAGTYTFASAVDPGLTGTLVVE